MTPFQVFLHNFTAVALNLDDPEKVERVLAKLKPADGLVDAIASVSDGMFGSVDFACDCDAVEGYQQALTDMIEAVQAQPFPPYKTLEARSAITHERENMVNLLYGVISGIQQMHQ